MTDEAQRVAYGSAPRRVLEEHLAEVRSARAEFPALVLLDCIAGEGGRATTVFRDVGILGDVGIRADIELGWRSIGGHVGRGGGIVCDGRSGVRGIRGAPGRIAGDLSVLGGLGRSASAEDESEDGGNPPGNVHGVCCSSAKGFRRPRSIYRFSGATSNLTVEGISLQFS